MWGTLMAASSRFRIFLCLSVISVSLAIPKGFIEKLVHLTVEDQVKEDVPFKPFPFIQWHKDKGVYRSGVKLNFHGDLPMSETRRLLDVFDNNMFVTAWVTSSLLEAFRYGKAPRPSESQLSLALKAVENHHDKNQLFNSSLMTFWPQTLNKTTNFWKCTPVNLLAAFELVEDMPLDLIESFLKVIGLGELAENIESIIKDKDLFLSSFIIPPDFDDTFVNLGLGSLLYQMKFEFPNAWQQWLSSNTNITSVFDALKKYAYRPFSNNTDNNSIDPRTYFYIRGFLDQAKSEGKDVALVPTWIQNIGELRKEFYLGVGMPFQINNVDVTVAANTIFGMTSSVLSGLVNTTVLEDPLVSQIYLNTSSMIAYTIKSNFTGRPDLALTYYPSRLEFYWFVSRTITVMETRRKASGSLPLPIMETVYQILMGAAQGPMTSYILSMAQEEEMEKFFFDDFLGDGDITHDNNTLVRGEDRIFTTAMAANALLYTWTWFDDKTGFSHWKKGTPDQVIHIATGINNWLAEHALKGKLKPWNAFFSGSAKGFPTLPFWYPGNRFEYLNGTKISDWSSIPNSTFLYALQGHVTATQYDTMLKQKHFGLPTPLTFNGYNAYSGYFPLWSSVPYTYASTLLAVTRYDSLVG